MTFSGSYRIYALLLTALFTLMTVGCSEQQSAQQQADKPQMLIYCGITMVNPIKEIAAKLEPELGVKFIITQGGSEDLYQSLNIARKGDLYLPGSASYRKRHIDEGLLGDFVHVGYNKAALFVAQHNPLGLTNDLAQLYNSDYKVVIGDPDSGSVGRETFKILKAAGISEKVRNNAVHMSTDSRALNYSLLEGQADIIINWRATGFFPENRPYIDIIDLPDDVAIPKKLLLNQLTFTAYPEKVRRFMDYASSEEGQAIFRKHGFLDKNLKVDM